MTNRKWLVLALSLGLAGAATAREAVQPQQLEIEDGDTLQVELDGASYRIQLPGIDAPENGINPKLQRDMQRTGLEAAALLPLGDAASEGLKRLLADFRPYRLVFDPQRKDRYGRTPGDLLDESGTPLSLRLVAQGYAIPAGPAAAGQQGLIEAAIAARQSGLGLWGSHPETASAWAGTAQ